MENKIAGYRILSYVYIHFINHKEPCDLIVFFNDNANIVDSTLDIYNAGWNEFWSVLIFKLIRMHSVELYCPIEMKIINVNVKQRAHA
jgi:hypothetical protein